jgi:hypothetical protein
VVLTGADGYLKSVDGRIGKCRNVNLNISKGTLRTTKQGDVDETYIPGLRNTTGSATLFYNPRDTIATSFLNSMLSDSRSPSTWVELVLSGTRKKSLSVNIILTEVGLSIAYGEAQVCEISFQVSGRITGVF